MNEPQHEVADAFEVIDQQVAQLPERINRRRQQVMTRSRFAAETGLDISTLKRIERNQTASLPQLLRICSALGIAPWELLGPLRYAQPRGRLARRNAKYGSWDLISRDAASANPVELELAPASSDGLVEHDGTEWLYVVAGVVQLQLSGDDDLVTLEARDAVEFDASIPHRVMNSGDTPAILLRRMSTAGLEAHLPTSAKITDEV